MSEHQPYLPMPDGGSEIIPKDIAITLLRSLSTCYGKVYNEAVEKAWSWVEDNKEFYEEMGG